MNPAQVTVGLLATSVHHRAGRLGRVKLAVEGVMTRAEWIKPFAERMVECGSWMTAENAIAVAVGGADATEEAAGTHPDHWEALDQVVACPFDLAAEARMGSARAQAAAPGGG